MSQKLLKVLYKKVKKKEKWVTFFSSKFRLYRFWQITYGKEVFNSLFAKF